LVNKKKYCLVTTADERTWPINAPILFLGEWCKRFSKKKKWLKLDAVTLKYHWDDREKLSKDYRYLQEIYEILLKDLSKQLNQIHNVNYSIRYWRILIGPWLGYFIQALFDRWISLNNALKDYDVERCYVLDKNPNSVIPYDMKNFVGLFVDDKWNEYIFGLLLKYSKANEIDIFPVNEEINEPLIDKIESPDITFKNIIKNIISRFNVFISRQKDYFFISSSIPLISQIKLQLKLKQIPSFWFSPKLEYVDIDWHQRKWAMENSVSIDKFIEVACHLIPSQIPIAYLEGFSILKDCVDKLSWPRNPSAIFTSNAYIDDEVFKAWTAENTESGTPLIIAQHGGRFGMTPFAFYEDHQLNIADKFLSWGWNYPKNTKIKPFGNIKLLNEQLKYNSNGNAIMIEMSLPRYSYHLYAVPISSQLLSYFNDQYNFMNELPSPIRKQVLVRLDKNDYGWDHKKRWENEFSDIKIDIGNTAIKKLLENSRLCIATENGTSYLETLAWNMPTIVFWSEEYWELNHNVIPYLDLLSDVGIFHKTSESAAQKVIEVWDDIESWWSNESLQKARKIFCENYSRMPSRPIDELKIAITTN
jgi:putative transferase (TIGR04331 family)